MRILFLFLFFTCLICSKAWAQPRTHPLAWGTSTSSNARTQATTPYTNTLKLPFFDDFSSRYLQIQKIDTGSPVLVTTLRPHGLVSNDAVSISGTKSLTVKAKLEGIKYVNRIDNYQFALYDDISLSPASETDCDTIIDYLRITKVGARETIIPDTLAYYYNQGGVQISTGSAKRQPSYYVARFDGLNENGAPYSLNSLAKGYTDSLRSQMFDLSTYARVDSLYMSFYYQHGGFGEATDADDHMYLEFFDKFNNWNVVKDLSGSVGLADTFYVCMVPIKDTIYLHNKFQYRFRSYGRQSGSYDVWNLDYIYINKNRTATDIAIYDFALRDGDTFLKKYMAMPFNHFFKKPNSFRKDTLQVITTNQNPLKKQRSMTVTIRDQFNGLLTTQSIPDTNLYKLKTYFFKNLNFTYPNVNQPMYIDQSYSYDDVLSMDTKSSIIPFDLMFNNFISKRTYLYDYYAYDDSEAESAFGTNFSGTQIAYKFVAEIKDVLTNIDICFARSKGPNLEGSQIYLMVWKNSLTEANEIYKEPISIHYQNFANGFVSYQLNNPITLDSLTTYYIGYEQNFPSLLTLGYDRNHDSRENMYYKESSTWVQMSDPGLLIDEGSMMMRPVFYKSGNNVPVGVKPPEDSKNGLLLYPNPATSTIDIIATDIVTDLQYTIYSLYGQVMSSGLITTTDHTIDVSPLSTGMYLVLCTDIEGKIYSTRFIKE